MFDVFGSVKGLLKLDQVCIDNNIFRLHYKATVIILVAFSLLVTSRQYIGDPIDCIVDEIPLNVMDTYCWIYSTFTIPNRLSGVVGKDIVQPGVGSHTEGEEEVKYHKYYQWVCFVLFFQGKQSWYEDVKNVLTNFSTIVDDSYLFLHSTIPVEDMGRWTSENVGHGSQLSGGEWWG